MQYSLASLLQRQMRVLIIRISGTALYLSEQHLRPTISVVEASFLKNESIL